MKLDVPYIVSDTRPEPVTGEVFLQTVEGGMLMFVDGDARETLTWDDDNPDSFVDDDEAGTLVIVTPKGSLLFTRA